MRSVVSGCAAAGVAAPGVAAPGVAAPGVQPGGVLMPTRRVAVVTGGGSGIGAATCARFAKDGMAVAIADRDLANAEAVAARIVAQGGEAAAVLLDAADPASVDAAMGFAETRFGSLDVMVASAGIGIQKSMLETTFEEWNAIIGVNLTGVFLCGKAAASRMKPRGFGRIINISSVAGMRGIPGRCAYGASKGGVNSLTRVMAVEFGPFGITVNAIAPGPINTPLTDRMHTEATRRAYTDSMPLGRYGTLAEAAGVAAFLASDDAAFVTGHTLPVDGGMAAAGPSFNV